MNYPNRAKETDRTNVELGLGRRATKAVIVSLLSLFLFFPISQNAAAQSAGFAFLEFTPFEQTEAAPGQYIILASHPVDGVCGITRNLKRHNAKAARAVSDACANAAGRSIVFNGCGGNTKADVRQICNAQGFGIALGKACKCDNWCPHIPGTKGPIPGLLKELPQKCLKYKK